MLSTKTITALASLGIWVGAISGYFGWPWQFGSLIGAAAGYLNAHWLAHEPMVGPVGFIGGIIFNVAMFGGLAYGAYHLVHWIAH